jgi:hypothetical protein
LRIRYGRKPETDSRPGRLPERAIVRPDDSIAFNDDDCAALFIEEYGL